MSDKEREHCAAVAREIRAKIETAPGDPTYRLAERIARERAAARREALEALRLRVLNEPAAVNGLWFLGLLDEMEQP